MGRSPVPSYKRNTNALAACGGNNGLAGTFDTKPPYHKEAKACMNAMGLIQPFASGSPFRVQVFTDHSPLTWIKHTSGKCPVSQFLVDKLSSMDFLMNYIKGPDNIVADAISRFPMLGPRVLKRQGTKVAFEILLRQLLNRIRRTTTQSIGSMMPARI